MRGSQLDSLVDFDAFFEKTFYFQYLFWWCNIFQQYMKTSSTHLAILSVPSFYRITLKSTSQIKIICQQIFN